MMQDMKLSKTDKKKDRPELVPTPDDGPDYPYGLCITLDASALKKLGLDMPKVGAMMSIEAVGIVKSCRMSQREGNADDSSVEIQIQRLEVEPDKKKTMQDAVDEGIEEAKESY